MKPGRNDLGWVMAAAVVVADDSTTAPDTAVAEAVAEDVAAAEVAGSVFDR